ncbi:MAG: hypothetical protein KF865_03175 [Bdellovibrionaceae bacterium]|nr:hypothetical protein [Pseudobdellovibrionaceae bacterium]
MSHEIEKKFKSILSKVSAQEKGRNRALARQTDKVLVAIEYLKACVKSTKGA